MLQRPTGIAASLTGGADASQESRCTGWQEGGSRKISHAYTKRCDPYVAVDTQNSVTPNTWRGWDVKQT